MNSDQLVGIGNVVYIDGDTAKISFNTESACSSCGAKVLCFPDKENSKTFQVPVPDNISLGDTVSVYETEDILLKLSLYQYGLPLLGFLLGIFLAYFIGQGRISELILALYGLMGLIIAAFISRYFVNKLANRKHSLFKVVKY